jgi:methylenetetrahydrofolate dehydrogenase (NADP+)/methenyltetrahydrofolate cyclohydrolase
LEHYNVETKGKHAVVIGRSNIVGRPISIMLSKPEYPGNCTVTVCHSHTQNLKELCLQGDIIIAALGRPEFLKADMVKDGAVVVDVGITRVPDTSKKSGFAIKGDVDFDAVAPKCSYITPVPGGVGPMTIAALMMNTYKACVAKD